MNWPIANNTHYEGPTELTLEEFNDLPATHSDLVRRAMLYSLQTAMSKAINEGTHEDAGPTMVPVHHFSKGIYARELTMPAGTRIVGERHAVEHLVVMLTGKCTVYTERGQEELVAPLIFKSPAGEKRALQIHETTTWLTIHPADTDDLDKAREKLILEEDSVEALNTLQARHGTLLPAAPTTDQPILGEPNVRPPPKPGRRNKKRH
jgi:quercetin dioxygenase-like cupin family protein